MILRRTGLLLVFLFVCGTVFSQIGFRISLANGPSIPTTAGTGTSFFLNVKVINDSASAFTGSLGFEYIVDTTKYNQPDSVSGINFFPQSLTIQPGDSAVFGITVKVTGPKFSVGPSVVVIWPVAANAQALDSLVFVLDVTTSVGSLVDNENLSMFMMNGSLYVHNPDGFELNLVKVYDLYGRIVQSAGEPTNGIPMDNNAAGVYIAELHYSKVKRKTFRFVYR